MKMNVYDDVSVADDVSVDVVGVGVASSLNPKWKKHFVDVVGNLPGYCL